MADDGNDDWTAEDDLQMFAIEALEEAGATELADRLFETPWDELRRSDDPKVKAAVAKAESEGRIDAIYSDDTLSGREKAEQALLASAETEVDAAVGMPTVLPLRVPSKYASASGRRSSVIQLFVITTALALLHLLSRTLEVDFDDDEAGGFFLPVLAITSWAFYALRRLFRWRDSVIVYGDRVVLQRLVRARTVRRTDSSKLLVYEGESSTSDQLVSRRLLLLASDRRAVGRVDLDRYVAGAEKMIASAFDMRLNRSRVANDDRAMGDAYPGSKTLMDGTVLGCLISWVAVLAVGIAAFVVTGVVLWT